MFTAEENENLTKVGPGTLMGELLRRYWTPACLSSELPQADSPPVRVRLLSEDLVAFRDTNGEVGLLEEHCAHRGASIYFGQNAECGLRCAYHGWKFDVSGQCVEMPSEARSFADRVRMKAYPTHESGGIVWTYMGPSETMTPFRDFGTESIPAEKFSAFKTLSTCNWVQAMEGNLDTAHISHLHQYNAVDDIPDDGTDCPGYPSNAMAWKIWRHARAPRLELQEEWYGFRYAGLRVTPHGNTDVRITAYIVPFSTIVPAIPLGGRHGMFVPIDDENCWRYNFASWLPNNPRNLGGAGMGVGTPYVFFRESNGGDIMTREYNAANDYQIDRELQKGTTVSGIRDFNSQDMMVTESMKPIYDRTREHLGSTDRAVIKMRALLLDAAKGLSDGKEPPAVRVGNEFDYRAIRSSEKILDTNEDWRLLGTDKDSAVGEALGMCDEVPAF